MISAISLKTEPFFIEVYNYEKENCKILWLCKNRYRRKNKKLINIKGVYNQIVEKVFNYFGYVKIDKIKFIQFEKEREKDIQRMKFLINYKCHENR